MHQLQTERNQRRNQYFSEPGGASVGETAGEGVWLNTVSTVQHGRDVLDNNHVKCTNADNPADNTGLCLFFVVFFYCPVVRWFVRAKRLRARSSVSKLNKFQLLRRLFVCVQTGID